MDAPTLVQIETADGPMPAQWFPPRVEPAATVVVFQEIFGVTDYVRRRCRDLVAHGYGVLAPQFYWRLADGGAVPEVTESGPEALETGFGLATRLGMDLQTATADGIAAVKAVQAWSGSSATGLLGFCWGGGVAFSVAAQTEPDVLVSYYGSGLPGLTDLAPSVTCPSLHHFGDSDSFIDAETQEKVRAAVTPQGAQWHVHPGADHAFDNNVAPWYHPQASVNAWRLTQHFLDDHLPTASVPHPHREPTHLREN